MAGLSLGFGLGLTMQRSAATDALLKLFGPTDNGLLLDSLAQQAYRDTDLTMLVSADGQAVAGLKDRSGKGNNGTQTTAASQATYDTDTAVPSLSLDGGDYYSTPLKTANAMSGSFLAKPGKRGVIVGASNAANSANRTYLYCATDTGLVSLGWGTGATGSGTTDLSAAPHVITFRAKNGQQEIYVDGELEVSGTITSDPGTTYPFNIGALNPGNGSADIKMTGLLYRGMMIDRYVTDDEVQIITKGLAKGVVTL